MLAQRSVACDEVHGEKTRGELGGAGVLVVREDGGACGPGGRATSSLRGVGKY